jgi:hypothetical protein
MRSNSICMSIDILLQIIPSSILRGQRKITAEYISINPQRPAFLPQTPKIYNLARVETNIYKTPVLSRFHIGSDVWSVPLSMRIGSLVTRLVHLAYSKAHIKSPTSGSNVVVADIDLGAAELEPIAME